MIGGRRPLQGRKVADRRVRVERPHSAYFRYTGPGMMTAKASASLAPAASRGPGRTFRRFLFGRRLSNEEEAFERLPGKLALPIFSSDAISSSAYIAPLAGLVAAAALLIDYVMTVAVSTAAAVSQVYSVVPELYDTRIEIALGAIAVITIANLRGLREAGRSSSSRARIAP